MAAALLIALLCPASGACAEPAASSDRTLTITVVGNGGVLKSPNLPEYPRGSTVVLTAIPAAHHHFVGWSDDASGSANPLSFVMDNNSDITATFAINLYTVAVTSGGNGTVSKSPNLTSHPYGSTVQMTAVAAANYEFSNWTGDETSAINPLDIVVTGNKSCAAQFVLRSFRLAIKAVGPGSVAVDPLQISYAPGSVVKLTAAPAPGYHFWYWAGDAAGSANPLSLVMDKSRNVTASFVSNLTDLKVPSGFSSQYLVRGLDEPVGMAFLPDGRLLVVELASAKIRMLVGGGFGAVDPVVVVDSVRSDASERGLLGIAIDPKWPQRPYVYVYYTALGGSIRVSRYTAQGDLENGGSGNLQLVTASRYDVLRDLPDELEFHNGGTLRFGPDEMLYLAPGDDGDRCSAQDSTALKGAMLRLDVRALPDGPGGPPDRFDLAPLDNPFVASTDVNERLLWAKGLRNPFRFHIDPANGDVFVGDVGFLTYEEVNHLAAPGINLGWPFLEGPLANPSTCPAYHWLSGPSPPIYAYDRTEEPAAVIGAGVYRASACAACNFPAEYEGDYFFSDFYQGFLRRMKFSNGAWSIASPVAGQADSQNWGLEFQEITDYATGPDGALWYCRMSVNYEPGTGEIGRVFRWPNQGLSAPATHVQSVTFANPYPLPAAGRVNFAYTLPTARPIALALFDLLGRRVRELVPETERAAGSHQTSWDGTLESGTLAPPGLYLARLVVGEQVIVRRVLVAR